MKARITITLKMLGLTLALLGAALPALAGGFLLHEQGGPTEGRVFFVTAAANPDAPLPALKVAVVGVKDLPVFASRNSGETWERIPLEQGIGTLPYAFDTAADLDALLFKIDRVPSASLSLEAEAPIRLAKTAWGIRVGYWGDTPSRLSASAHDPSGDALPLRGQAESSAGLNLGIASWGDLLEVRLDPIPTGPFTFSVTDEAGRSESLGAGGPTIEVNEPPVAWPSETIGTGGWTVYTQQGSSIKDLTGNPDCSRGASVTGMVDISRGDSPYYDSCLYSYNATNQVFYYRVRVDGQPLTNSARTTGNGTGADPWANSTWNLLIDLDGDGWREFNVVLAGDSGGGGSRDISVVPGSNDGDDLKIYYSNSASQCVTSETISNNQITLVGDLVWWGNAATQSATVPGNPAADGATWNFGRSRMVYHTAANATWGSGHFVDFQFPLAACTDAYNGGSGGNGLLGPQTPITFGYTTSNSNSDPLQKDFASSFCYTPSCSTRFPYADALILASGISAGPVIGAMALTAITCPTQATVSAGVTDTLAVEPPGTGSGTVVDTIASVTFQYYFDANGNGVADDGSTWTNMAVVGSSLNPDTRGDLAPDGITASFNDWGVVWNTSALASGLYLIRVSAVDNDTNTTVEVVGSYNRVSGDCRAGNNVTWESYSDYNRTVQSDSFTNSPSSTVYMGGEFASQTTYNVAFYDSTGARIQTRAVHSYVFGSLEDSLAVGGSNPAGTYHSMVYTQSFTPPATYSGTYNATTNPFLADDAFVVTSSVFPSPTVNSPILAGASSISGTSTAAVGTTITVYSNGSAIGTTTVQAGGTWTLPGVTGLAGGESITATAGTGSQESPPSAAVVVTPGSPSIDGPLSIGQTTITGTSTAPVGSTITVYVNGTPYTTTVQAGGTWSVTVPALTGGDQVYATATAGGQTSAPSATLAVPFAAPVLNSPILAGASSISGTSTAAVGTTITVYSNGSAIGTTTVQAGGTWTLSGVSGLIGGESITATAGTGASESTPSAPVVVTPGSPSINGPLSVGQTSVTGTSTAPVGSTITVYVDGAPYTTTVQAGGTWSVTVPALVGGDSVYANVTAGGQTSANSATLTVTFAAPTVSSPILAGASSISGTSTAAVGTTVTVYNNGSAIGTTTVQAGGTWTLSGVSGLIGGESITATAGTGASESTPSAPVIVTPSPPAISSPVYNGATDVSGTNTAPVGSTVTLYKNGSPIGSTTVQAGGTWTVSGISPALANLDQLTATVTANGATSAPSVTVVVEPEPSGDTSLAPIVSSPLTAGASQTVVGSSVEAPGTSINLYLNGSYASSVTVQADGTWSWTGVPLSDGDYINATAQASGELVSGFSNTVIVGSGSATTPPVITAPIAAASTSVSGTSQPNAVVDVYADGVYLGSIPANGSGDWTLSGLAPLANGAIVNATASLMSSGTSEWSAPVIVGTTIDLLRSDLITSLSQPVASVFARPWAPAATAMDPLGAKHKASWGEGAPPQPESPGTLDGDKAYAYNVTSGYEDADPTVLTDDGRPLVFYELLDNGAKTIYLEKTPGGTIKITFAP
jgi:hypothetical protein